MSGVGAKWALQIASLIALDCTNAALARPDLAADLRDECFEPLATNGACCAVGLGNGAVTVS